MGLLAAVDWAIVVAYFVVVFGVAVWAYRSGTGDEGETAEGYFLGGRNVGWFVVGASLFVSNIGSEHLVGLSGTGADSGVAVGQFEILASLVLLLLGWVFVPFYVRSGVFTMPEFLERRYNVASRRYLTAISIVGYVLTKISVTLFAGGIVFEVLMGVDFWTGALITVVFTGIYTVIGGLRAVVYTDMMQMIVLLFGSITVTVMGLAALGGVNELVTTVPDGFMSVWKPVSDPSFPWTGIVFGAPILAVWYWCTDQYIVQRTLAARNITNAREGTIFAGFLKLLPLFIFVIPGVIAFALAERGELELGQSDEALPLLVGEILPIGLRGIVVAGLLAALMSSLSSVFNSTSTLVTWDVFRELRPDASERQLVWVGRVATVVLTGIALAWIPFMDAISSTLYEYLQSVQSYIAPPIAAVFLLGLMWRRINGVGAITSLLVGFVIGAFRLIIELVNGADRDGLPSGGVLEAIAEFNFLHFAIVLFVICVAVLVIVSLLTDPPPAAQLAGLTFATAQEPVQQFRPQRREEPAPTGAGVATRERTETEPEVTTEADEQIDVELDEDPRSRRRDALLSALVIVGVLAVWLLFSPLVF